MNELSANRTKHLKHNKQCKEYEEKIFHKYDKALRVYWMPDIMRYSIWTTDKKGNAYMLCVCVGYIDKTAFREPNERDLHAIHKMDLYRKEKSFSLYKHIEEKNADLEVSKKKQLSDNLCAISKERWRQCMGHLVINVGSI